MPLKRYQRGSKGGTGSIAIGDTSVVITHGLGVIPSGYGADAIRNSLGQDIWIDDTTVTSTTMTVKIDAPQVDIVYFSWHVDK